MSKIKQTEIDSLKKYVRAANYLSVAQIYLKDNILLKEPLKSEHIKPRLLGHWGTCPGISFVYAQINRLIKNQKASFLYVVGPGHGFPAIQANLFLEKSLSKFYPEKIPYNEKGIEEICKNFSAPYGYPSHSNPAAPGAILEGGELGYSLSVSFGAVLDNPDLIVCCLVGDGEAETGPLAAAWHANKVLNPAENGAVLPVVHLNGYKISGPTILGRMSNKEIKNMFTGFGYKPFIVEKNNKQDIYATMAETMDQSYHLIRDIQNQARSGHDVEKPQWPVIILKTPKGWTGVKTDQNTKLEGNCKSHQVILSDVKTNDKHLKKLEQWLKSYDFHKLISSNKKEFQFEKGVNFLIPPTNQACGQQKYAYGGEVFQKITLPNLKKLAISKKTIQDNTKSSSMSLAGSFLKELFKLNKEKNNFRIFSPDETYSNKIDAVFTETKRSWQWPLKSFDTDLQRQGKVIEMLSEHTLFGMLHGYTVTGRLGLFVSYEAFVQVIASMADQYAKFIKASLKVPFRKPLPALNIILTSLLERQDHNGFSHQNPSFLSSMLEKDNEIISAYLPPDANSMLVTMTKIMTSTNSLNLIIAGKKEQYNWLTLEQAQKQMKHGIMTWDFISDKNPDIVLTSSGDYVTNETLAAIPLLKSSLPQIKIRFVNVSELTALSIGDKTIKSDTKFLDKYFTKNKGVIFNFHGYPQTIKKLLFDYSGSNRFKINGYIEEGSTTTPFDMETRNKTSRYHIILDAIEVLLQQKNITKKEYQKVKIEITKKLQSHKKYILKNGNDPQEITDWKILY